MNRIIERIESCIKDPRREPMVAHSQTEMLRQRIYQIMSGLGDADDCDRLCRDGILKLCTRRSASDEIDLASQPTITRLESRLSRKELFDIGEAFSHIERPLSERPCDAGEMRTNRSATAKTKRGSYE